MAGYYILKQDGTKLGPVGAGTLRRAYAIGLITPGDHCWTDSMERWQSAEEFISLQKLAEDPCRTPLASLIHTIRTAGFRGKSTRKELAMSSLCYCAALAVLLGLVLLAMPLLGLGYGTYHSSVAPHLTTLCLALSGAFFFPLAIRRAHDCGAGDVKTTVISSIIFIGAVLCYLRHPISCISFCTLCTIVFFLLLGLRRTACPAQIDTRRVLRDHYAKLGLPQNATSEDIERAFYTLAATYDPETAPGADATQAARKLDALADSAYVLLDPQQRDIYDKVYHRLRIAASSGDAPKVAAYPPLPVPPAGRTPASDDLTPPGAAKRAKIRTVAATVGAALLAVLGWVFFLKYDFDPAGRLYTEAMEELGPGGYRHRAAEKFIQAAEAGHPESLTIAADFLYKGIHADQDYAKAYGFYARAAQNGDPKGKAGMARCLILGHGTAVDVDKALKLYAEAQEAGITLELDEYGIYCLLGANKLLAPGSTEADKQAGYLMLKKAAATGNHTAQYELGLFYQYGTFGEKDEAAAFELFNKAAIYPKDAPRAELKLGECHLHGIGTPISRDQAYIHLYQSMREGIQPELPALLAELYSDFDWVRGTDTEEVYAAYLEYHGDSPHAQEAHERYAELAIQRIESEDHEQLIGAISYNGEESAPATFTVRNKTGFDTSLILQGPESKCLTIPAQGEVVLRLPCGNYDIAISAAYLRKPYLGAVKLRGGHQLDLYAIPFHCRAL